MNGKRAVLIGAGDFFETRDTLPTADVIIAADGGYASVTAAGMNPDVLVGDFDSLTCVPVQGEIVRLPKEKDDTDMIAAAKIGLERGCTDFYIYGGTGGRFDHTIANLQLLSFLSKKGARGFLFSKTTVSTVLRDAAMTLDGEEDGYVSVFCLSDTATGVTIEGLKYPLTDAVLTNDFPLGVSNELTGHPARIAVKNGTLLVVFPRA